jgi:hypothetical protein
MSDPIPTLFIGGPWDGRQVVVNKGDFNLEVRCEAIPLGGYLSYNLDPSTPVHFETVTYGRCTLLGHTFMVDRRLTHRNTELSQLLMKRLIEGYRRCA